MSAPLQQLFDFPAPPSPATPVFDSIACVRCGKPFLACECAARDELDEDGGWLPFDPGNPSNARYPD